MPTQVALYQEVEQQMTTITAAADVRITSVRRLALLVTGIIAAKSCVLAQVAAELAALHLTEARWAESIARRLRRTLNDPALTAATCYEPVLPRVIDWPAVLRGSRRVVLIVDESSKADEVHLFRVSLAYWGAACRWGGRCGRRTSRCRTATTGRPSMPSSRASQRCCRPGWR